MVAFVTDYIHSCSVCSHSKSLHHKPFGPIDSSQSVNDLGLYIDGFHRGLPLSEGRDTILVVVCCLTKMALFIPTFHDIDAEDLARIFLSQVFAKHGTLADIVSDRGKHFILWFWRSLCQLLGIKSNLSTAYHPETDGKTECVNQILEQYLQVYVNYQQDDWVNLLPLAEFAYNNTSHSATMVTHSSPTRASIPNLKCPLNLLCRRLLTKSLQISRNCTDTFVTRSGVPSSSTRPILHCDAALSPIQGQRHCLAGIAEHTNHTPL